MKVPVVLPLVEVRVDDDGTVDATLDGEPLAADRPLTRSLVRVDGAIKVEAVSPDGRLGQSGIRPDDVIASIGPEAVGALSDAEVNARLEDPATQSIGVQRDGKSVGVRLRGMSPGER